MVPDAGENESGDDGLPPRMFRATLPNGQPEAEAYERDEPSVM
jgi:hypothetical protein